LHILYSRFTLALKTKNPLLMKRRITTVLNFFAFNLLFFALYLNFVHKDNNTIPVSNTQTHSAVQHTTVVENADQYIKKVVSESSDIKQTSALHDEGRALRLSIN
jgi:hypothetical protein